jgi:hypothetical protein
VTVSLLWVVVAPVYAQGLVLVGRALIPVLETAPGTRYVVEGGRLLAQRPTWLAKQQRTAPLYWPLWVPTANYGVPLLAALILATPGWSWRRRGRALAVGLGLVTLTQIAFLLVTIVATQQSPVMSPEGMLQVPGFSPTKQSIFYALYYFFDITGRGFFALIIYLGLIAVGWQVPEATPPVPRGRPLGRNDPCPCGSGRKYKRCCLA